MKNDSNKYRKIKIIVLSVLLGLTLIFLITSAVLRSAKTDAPDEGGGVLTAKAESAVLTADADAPIGIVPTASGTPSLQLTKNSHSVYISSGSYVNGNFGAIMTNADRIRLQEVNGNTNDYYPSADRFGFYRSDNGWYKLWAVQENIFGGVRTTSGEYTVGLDTVNPVMTAYANGATVSNNSTVRHTITYSATDNFSGVQYYYFSLNGGSYVSGGSGAILSADGVYKLYCVDRAGNSSSVINVTKDGTAPTVRAYNGSSQVSSGAVTTASSVRFEATDNLTGVDGIYIRSPGVTYYTMYTGTAVTLSTEGTYYYYAKDKAGNQSATYTVTVDRTAPSVTLYSGTSAVSSGYYSAASYVRFTASDTNGCTIYMRKESGSYSAYTSGTNLTAEGVYSFYATDVVGNATATYTITLDRTAPTGTLYAGTATATSGKITNASYVTYTATDNLALNYLYVLKPGASSYVTFTSGTQFTADGWYYFYATDKSGNATSTMSILLDRTKPTVTVYGGSNIMPNGGYTNKSVSFTTSDATSGIAAMYVRLPGSSSYITYATGTTFIAEGTYYFYTTDVAGNASDTATVTIDLVKPIGKITANGVTVNSGGYTNKAFYFTATDSVSGVAKCEIKRPNGAWEAYTSGTTIAAASINGWYSFRATDTAGNVSDEIQVCLISAAPFVTINAGTTTVPSGTYTNKGYVSFAATATFNVGVSLYVRLPGAGGYITYGAGTPLYGEGIYYFYATDNAGNVSGTVNVTLDTTKPLGTVVSDGADVPNDGYTNNAFYYTAADALSGVLKCEIKRPNGAWETYAAGTEILSDEDGGWYAFRSYDHAGNVSDESRVCLMTTMPDITIYAGTDVIASGTFTNKGYVSFAASDAISGTTTLFVRMPGTSKYIAYVAETPLYGEGTYYVYATDAAGNRSDEVNVTLDMTSPTGTITTGGATVGSDSYTNKAFSYSAADDLSGVFKCEIKAPNGAWEPYTAGTSIPVTSAGGWYAFRSYDRAGNVSIESRSCLIIAAPDVSLYADEQLAPNGTYTNAARISMSANGGYVKACYVKTPGASGYIAYTQYFSFTAAGRYEFFAEDFAGGTSGVFVIIIDRTAKPVDFNGVEGGSASGNVILTWENSDTSKLAPIASVTVNGVPYQKGNAIKTIDGGVYLVKTTDAAGNVWTDSFGATRTEILSDTLNKKYFETIDSAGDSFAFENYDNALAFAMLREAGLVRTGTWSSATWDGGIPMDFLDSANAKNGTYYIYKKSGDKTAEVAYFTLDRLNAVIAEYAAQTVTSYYWWQKVPAQIYGGDNLYALTADRIFVGNSVELTAHANYLIDGEPYSGLTYSVEGEHILTVYDDFGNSYEYTLIIVKTAPDILYKLGGGVFNKAASDRQYIFKEAVTLKIEDALGGDFAMYVIKNSAGETVAIVSYGDQYVLDKSGRYHVYAVNHGGTSAEITFVLSLISPTATFKDNADSKRLELRIAPSADSGATLTGIKIYKSIDGGLTWTERTSDDYGRTVSASILFYEFNRDGLYRVVVEDNFRSGIDAIVATADYTKPAPEGALHGVTDGGYTNGAVKFSWDDEAEATVTFNSVTSEYLSGTELSDDGEYTLNFTDVNGFETTYTFTIKTAMPTIELSVEPVDGYLTEPVTVTFEPDCTALLYKNGEFVGDLENETLIDIDGEYTVTVIDLAGNVTTVSFIIDTTAPTAELDGVDNGGKTGGGVIIKNVSEDAGLKVYFNGELTEYRLGETLTAIGTYKVSLTDAAGNMTEYSFDIIYTVNAAGVIIIIVVILVAIGGAAAVILLRRRGKFKSNKAKK